MSSITDVGGILVGHHQRIDSDATLGSGWASGTTVVLTPPGTVGAVDVPRRRARHPGDRPARPVQHACATSTPSLLTGGSAYGLAAADGVMRWLEEHGRGVAMDRRRGADRARRGDLRPARRRVAVPADGRVRLRRGRERRRPRSPTAPSVRASGARAGVLKGGVGTASMMLRVGRHRRRDGRRQRGRRRRSTRPPDCRGWPT